MTTRLSVMRQRHRIFLVLEVRLSILLLDLTLPGTTAANLLLVLLSSLTSRIALTEVLALRLAQLLVLALALWRRTMLSDLTMTVLVLILALATTPRAMILLALLLETLLLRPTNSRALTETIVLSRALPLV